MIMTATECRHLAKGICFGTGRGFIWKVLARYGDKVTVVRIAIDSMNEADIDGLVPPRTVTHKWRSTMERVAARLSQIFVESAREAALYPADPGTSGQTDVLYVETGVDDFYTSIRPMYTLGPDGIPLSDFDLPVLTRADIATPALPDEVFRDAPFPPMRFGWDRASGPDLSVMSITPPRSESDMRAYTCMVCGVSYRALAVLSYHELTEHGGTRPQQGI